MKKMIIVGVCLATAASVGWITAWNLWAWDLWSW